MVSFEQIAPNRFCSGVGAGPDRASLPILVEVSFFDSIFWKLEFPIGSGLENDLVEISISSHVLPLELTCEYVCYCCKQFNS
jgi:hypothetical protein